MAHRNQTAPDRQVLPMADAAAVVVRVFGDLRFHTDGEVLALGYAADGTLWSLEEPGVLRQWDTGSGRQCRWTYLSDLETLWGFSADARTLASASDDLSLWDVATGQLITVMAQPSWVTAVAFAPDLRYVATGHDDGVARLWDAVSQSLVREFADGHDGPISAAGFSPDGRRFASAGEDKLIRIWDSDSGRLLGTLEGHTDRIQGLAWVARGDRLVSAGWDTTARLWDTKKFEPVILLNSHADQVTALAVSDDGALLACADSANMVHVWDLATAKVLHVLAGHKDEVHSLAFAPDGRQLASGGAERMIYLWDARDGKLLSGQGEPVATRTSLAVSPDGNRLASTCGGAGLRVWEVATGKIAVEPDDCRVQVVAASPDGRWLAGGGADKRIRLWDAASGQVRATLEGQAGEVAALAFAPDSRQLVSASASDGTVWLWDVASAQPTLVIPEAADNCVVESVAFDPQGRFVSAAGIDWLATGGSDGAIGLWDVAGQRPISMFDGGCTCVAVHPSGRWLAAATLTESVSVWDIKRRQVAAELTGHEGAVNCVAYSSDGRWLASAGDDRTIRLWDAQTSQPVGACELDTQVKALCFSPDSRHLFTGNGNTTSYQIAVERLLYKGSSD